MRTPAWPELLRLPEREAGFEYLQRSNRQHLLWLLGLWAGAATVVTIVNLTEARAAAAIPWLVVLAFVVGLLLVRRQPFFLDRSDDFQIALLALALIAIALTLPEPTGVLSFAAFVFPGFMILFRWRAARLWAFVGVCAATAAWAVLTAGEEEPIPLLIVAALITGTAALLGQRATRRRLAAFAIEYRRQASVERDRTRMSEELSDARAVQLSMLPRATPELAWVDVASACLPASEVGGDYYDFLVLDDDRLAVVVADVAGHGMASGLVLAGVRSGLYLLRDELDRGVEVLAKLDAMLQSTAPGRMFVTLQVAVLDRRRRRLTVANAGHPPLLLISNGAVSSVGAAGPPLGTRLDPGYEMRTADLDPGDTLVLFSDGLSETRNRRGATFDGARLEREILRAAEQSSARGVRDQVLARISHFKGDVEQDDDLTLVILRLAGGR